MPDTTTTHRNAFNADLALHGSASSSLLMLILTSALGRADHQCGARTAHDVWRGVVLRADPTLRHALVARRGRLILAPSIQYRASPIHRFDSANSVTICAVFFAKPR